MRGGPGRATIAAEAPVKPLHDLCASEALALLSGGEISSEDLVRACLARIAAEEPRVGAWAFLDEGLALAEARRVDGLRPRPPLAGLPVGVKDIFDTAGLPTECGTPILAGRRPARDAAAVARLRAAGAVILGKTVTTEFAFYAPGKTRNPRDPSRTPGGSSSGSAAAVASGMVPAAIGSQTAGSIIRPASFCGVVGMKPTHGIVPLEGASAFAPSLDTAGLFAREVADLPPLLAALGVDSSRTAAAAGPLRVGLCRTEQWPLAEPSSRAAVERAAALLAGSGVAVEEVDLGPAFTGLAEAQRTVMATEAAETFRELRALHGDRLSPVLRDFIDSGAAMPPARVAAARAQAERCRALLPGAFAWASVLLTPSAIGEAPAGLASTGDPARNRIWTLLGAPCLSLPGATGPAGLPVGVQLVCPPGRDGDLVAAAAAVEARLSGRA